MLGEIGDGFKVAMSALDNGRYSVAAGCVGSATAASTPPWPREGAPAVRRPDRQLPAHPGADRRHGGEARRSEAAGLAGGALKDRGVRNTVETSIAKYYATEAAVDCANAAIQVHGGSGYVDDYPVERYLRDARVTTLYEGTSQIHKLIIGRDATGINAMVPPRLVTPLVEPPRQAGGALPAQPPGVRNAPSPGLRAKLADAVERFDADEEIHCIVIAGTTRRSRRALTSRRSPITGWTRSSKPEPILLAADGFGAHADDRRGIRLGPWRGLRAGAALRHDRRLRRLLSLASLEITLAIIPGGGGTQRLARTAGKARAMELVLTGRMVHRREALEMGLVNQVTKQREGSSAPWSSPGSSPSAHRLPPASPRRPC